MEHADDGVWALPHVDGLINQTIVNLFGGWTHNRLQRLCIFVVLESTLGRAEGDYWGKTAALPCQNCDLDPWKYVCGGLNYYD